MFECVARRMAGRNYRERVRDNVREQVGQERFVNFRSPIHVGLGLFAKTRPVDGDGSERLRKPLLQGMHFASCRNRAERWQQENARAHSSTVEADGEITAIATPGYFLMCHL